MPSGGVDSVKQSTDRWTMSNSNLHKYLQLERLGLHEESETLKRTERLFVFYRRTVISNMYEWGSLSHVAREEGQVITSRTWGRIRETGCK